MVFPVIRYRCKSWTIKKASVKKLMFSNCGIEEDSWESLELQGDQTILKEINIEYSLEGLMLKLKFQYSGHQMRRANSLEKTLKLGKIEGRRRTGQKRMRWLDGHWANSGRWWRTGEPGMLQSMGLQSVRCDLVTKQQQFSNWILKALILF